MILAWDMGSGKTAAVLTALRDLLDSFTIRKALIVAPKLVAQTTWPDEIEEWAHTRVMSWTLLRADDDDPRFREASDRVYAKAHARLVAEVEHQVAELRARGVKAAEAKADVKAGLGGTPSERAEAARSRFKDRYRQRLADQDTELHIINKEGLPWLWDHFGRGSRWPYHVIVIDEATMLKSGQARSLGKKDDQTGKRKVGSLSRFGIIAAARKHVDAVIEMTGTPAPRGLENLWGLAYPIDLGERLGRTKTAFMDRWFVQNRYSYKIKPRESAEPEILAAVSDIMFSLDPKDYAELPPMLPPNFLWVDLPADVMKQYRAFERTMVAEDYDVEAVNAGVQHNKLLQFANGSLYQEDGADVHVHDLKLDRLAEVVAELDGEPLLVAYTYRFDIARIQKRFPRAVVLNETDPRDTVARWNAGQIDMLLCHRASAGHGLNLQFGGHHLVEYGLTSDLELYLQFNKRLHRPGQTRPVFHHVIAARGTIDQQIYPMYLDPKAEVQDRVLESVMVRLLDS